MIQEIWDFLTPYAVWFAELFESGKLEPSEYETATGCFILLLLCVCVIGTLTLLQIYYHYRNKRMEEEIRLENERGYKLIE